MVRGDVGWPGTSVKVALKLAASCNVVPRGQATATLLPERVIVRTAVPVLPILTAGQNTSVTPSSGGGTQ